MLLGLATLTSVMCPVSAASLHTTTAPTSSVRSMNRRQRRAFGERSNSKRRREHHNMCDDDDLHDNIRINFTPVPMSEEDDEHLDTFIDDNLDIPDGCEPDKDNDNLDTFIDDMPGSEETTIAEEFLKIGVENVESKTEPVFKKGDTVWLYRRRQKMWVTATVVDLRMYSTDGCYLVTVANGTKFEAFDKTLRPRQVHDLHTTNKTAAWRRRIHCAPKPVLAGDDDRRVVATSILRAAFPKDMYWSGAEGQKQIRLDAKIKAEKVCAGWLGGVIMSKI